MERKTTIRVIELKTPHPRQFERMMLIDGALVRDEADYLEALDEVFIRKAEMPPCFRVIPPHLYGVLVPTAD